MSVLSNAIMGGLAGAGLGALCWKRKEEKSSTGQPCMRYFGPRFLLPVGVIFSCGVFFLHPEDAAFALVFLCVTLLLSIHFVLYSITLSGRTIERVQWPLRTLTYAVDDLTFIGQKGRETVLHFRNGEKLKILLLLSGQTGFIEKLQSLLVARVATQSSSRSTRKKRHK